MSISPENRPVRRRAALRIAAGATAVLAATGVAVTMETTASASDTAASTHAAKAETHVFSGSSTSAAAFQDWFNGGEFKKPTIETRDLTTLTLPNGQVAEAGDTIAKIGDKFLVLK